MTITTIISSKVMMIMIMIVIIMILMIIILKTIMILLPCRAGSAPSEEPKSLGVGADRVWR